MLITNGTMNQYSAPTKTYSMESMEYIQAVLVGAEYWFIVPILSPY